MDMHPRKKIILTEAARLFRAKSYEAATLREMAGRSGIRGASVYYHFSSKQEILFNIMDFTMSELTFLLKESLRDQGDAVSKLRKAIETHIVYHINNLEMTYVTDSEIRSLTEENHDFILRKRRKYEKLFSDILDEGIGEGRFHIRNSKLVAFAILQMCTGVSYWYKADGPLKVQDIVDIYFEFACAGALGLVTDRLPASFEKNALPPAPGKPDEP
jgi:AcrR family transcriptional regulator